MSALEKGQVFRLGFIRIAVVAMLPGQVKNGDVFIEENCPCRQQGFGSIAVFSFLDFPGKPHQAGTLSCLHNQKDLW